MRLSELAGKKVTLFGVGRETIALIEAVDQLGIECEFVACAVERRTGSAAEQRIAERMPIARRGVKRRCLDSDVVVRSPWIRTTLSSIEAARAEGVVVTTSTSLWLCEHDDVPLFAVTGTKGKSTTTLMVAHLLSRLGKRCVVGGNIGNALCSIDPRGADYIVAELSSFQMLDLARAPEFLLVTNLHSDHVKWHVDRAAYHAAKLQPLSRGGVQHLIAGSVTLDQVLATTTTSAELHTAHGSERELPTVPMRGRHNRENAAIAIAAVRAAGIAIDDPDELFADFVPPAARLEVAFDDGEQIWVNDQHATTVEAAAAGFEAFGRRPMTLVSGGRVFDLDFEAVRDLLAANSELRLVIFGEAAQSEDSIRLRDAGVGVQLCADVAESVVAARAVTKSGGGVVVNSLAKPERHLNFEQQCATVLLQARTLQPSLAGSGISQVLSID